MGQKHPGGVIKARPQISKSEDSNESRQIFPSLKAMGSFHASRQAFIKNKTDFNRDYEMKERVGEGSYGEVWKAIDRKTGQERAVKIMLKHRTDPKEYDQLMEEVNMLINLDHPNILRMYDFYDDTDKFYIVTELLSGGELFEKIIEYEHFTEKRAASIMLQILSAVAYCHKFNVAHRDIKPENIIFDSKAEDTLKIIDFGLAQTFRPQQRFHGLIGTAYYVAPEVLTSEYSEKCDIWSCGVLLYVMLSGCPPFDGDTEDKICQKVIEGKYDFDLPVWDHISETAKNLIRRMMEYNPEKRYSAQEALNDLWFKKFNEPTHVEKPVAKQALSRLSTFRVGTKLQEAAWIFLVNYFSTKDDMEKLMKTFEALDLNHDGQLTKEELTNGYVKIMGMTNEQAEEQADRIFKALDRDNDGLVNFTEFVNAATSKQEMITKEKLESAFRVFDKNGDGEISAEELKFLFNNEKIQQLPGDVWKKWIDEVDKNKDGKVSLEEFKSMMLALFSRKEDVEKAMENM